MSVDLPVAFNVHQGDPDADPLRVANVGTPTSTASKASGGVSLNNSGQQWQEGTVGETSGIRWEFVAAGTAQDLTIPHELFVIACQVNAPNRVQLDTIANEGMSIRMYSSANGTNYRAFYVGGQDSIYGKFRSAPTAFMVDVNGVGNLDSGTYDATAIENYSVQTTKADQAGTTTQWSYVSEAWRIGTEKGATNIPRLHGAGVMMKDLPIAVEGTDHNDIRHVFCQTLSEGIYFVGCPVAIGNESGASTVTTFDDEGFSFIFPGNQLAADPRFHITPDAMRHYLDLRNNIADTAMFSGTWTYGVASPIDHGQNDAAVVTYDNPTFTGTGNFTVGSSVTGPATWNLASGSSVILIGGDIDGSTINGDLDIQGLVPSVYTGLTITGAMDFDAAGTYTLDACIVEEVTNSSGGAVTLNLINQSLITTNTGPNITISNNVNLKITVLDVNTFQPIENARVLLEAAAGGPLAVGTDILTGLTNNNGELTGIFSLDPEIAGDIVVDWGATPVPDVVLEINSAVFEDVDQITPVSTFDFVQGLAATSAQAASLGVSSGELGVYSITHNVIEGLSVPVGYTEGVDLSGVAVGFELFSAGGTTQPEVTWTTSAAFSMTNIIFNEQVSAITLLDEWTTGGSKVASSGSNRMLLVSVNFSSTSDMSDVSGVTFGGQPLVEEIEDRQASSSPFSGYWFGYLNNAGILASSPGAGTADQPVTGRARQASTSTFYKQGNISSVINENGLDVTILMVPDE